MKKLIYYCTVCKKLNSCPYEYPSLSDLPELRFNETFPFASTGVDYLGPLYCLPIYAKGDDLHKAYVVIYTCATTRDVILDVVSNANTDNFLNSFKRFFVVKMLSDNGSRPEYKLEIQSRLCTLVWREVYGNDLLRA